MRYLLILLVMFSCQLAAQQAIVSGYIETHKSSVLAQMRRYMIDLPENYHDNNLSYPTLYVIDGDFQFQHVAAITKNLARMGKIPPMIVVGIANQGNADYLYQTTWQVAGETDFGGAEKFYQYISTELLPQIDGTYRTNNNRILSGYSLGGLFTTFAMMQKNTPFNAFFAMSPSYWFDDYSPVDSLSGFIATQAKQNLTPAPLFLSIANEQGMGVKKAADKLESLAIKDWRFNFSAYPQENHFSTALPALVDALNFLFPDFYLDGYQLAAHKDVFDVLNTFKQKQNGYNGFSIEWLQAYKLAKYIFASKQVDKVDAVLAEVAQQFPASLLMVSNYLAKGFNATKQYQQAKTILQQVTAQGKNNALWHHQYSLALSGLGQQTLAKNHQAIAMDLAEKQQLPMWQVWEMK